MKGNISAPVGIAIVVIVLIAIVAFAYKQTGGASKHSNEEVMQHLGGAQNAKEHGK